MPKQPFNAREFKPFVAVGDACPICRRRRCVSVRVADDTFVVQCPHCKRVNADPAEIRYAFGDVDKLQLVIDKQRGAIQRLSVDRVRDDEKLKKALIAERTRASDLEALLKTANEKVTKLESGGLKDDLDKALLLMAAMEDKVVALEKIKADYKALKAKIGDPDGEESGFIEYDQMGTDLAEGQRVNQILRIEIARIRDEIATLRADSESDVMTLRKEIESLESNNDCLKIDLKESQAAVVELKDDLKKKAAKPPKKKADKPKKKKKAGKKKR